MTALQEYLAASAITQGEFAERVGVKQATISRLCNGAIGPSLELAARIERATGGAVTAISWVAEAPVVPSAKEDVSGEGRA